MSDPLFFLVLAAAGVVGFVVLYFLVKEAVSNGVVSALDRIANRTAPPTGAHSEDRAARGACGANVLHSPHRYMTFSGPERCPGIGRG